MGIDWSNIVLTAANIGTTLLKEFLPPSQAAEGEEEQQTGQGVIQGDVQWRCVNEDGNNKIKITNNGSRPYGVNFARSGTQIINGNISPFVSVTHVPLNNNEEKTVTSELDEYHDGHVCVAPLAANAFTGLLADDTQDKTLTYSISYLPLGTTIDIYQGKVNMRVDKTQEDNRNKYKVILTHDSEFRVKRIEVSARGGNGHTVSGSKDISTALNEATDEPVELPEGTNLDPLIESLTVTLTLPSASYLAMYSEVWAASEASKKQ